MKTIKKDKSSGIKGRYVLFCDYALISQDGKVSIIGEFDRIYTSADHAHLNKGYLVSKIVGTPNSDISLEILLSDENSKDIVMKNNLGLKLDNNGNAGLILELLNLKFQNFGTYKVKIELQGKILAETQIEVVKVSTPNIVRT